MPLRRPRPVPPCGPHGWTPTMASAALADGTMQAYTCGFIDVSRRRI